MAELFVDYISQPCRAVALFCRLNKLDITETETIIYKGQHRTSQILQVNPVGKLPFLQDKGSTLTESATILRYLAVSREVPDHWYPADLLSRARVDAALDWYQTNIRHGAGQLFWNGVIEPQAPDSEVFYQRALQILQETFKLMETYWLKETAFAAGEEISVADLLWFCEIDQLQILKGSQKNITLEGLLEPYPAVREWMQRVQQYLGPEYGSINKVLEATMGRFVARKERRRRQQQQRTHSKL